MSRKESEWDGVFQLVMEDIEKRYRVSDALYDVLSDSLSKHFPEAIATAVSNREKEIAEEVKRELKELEVRELSDEEVENEISKIVTHFCSELTIKKAFKLADLARNDFGRTMRNKTLKRALDKVITIIKR